jgi:hypothetical protein
MHLHKLLLTSSILLLATIGARAMAPASLAGKVYHDTGVHASLRLSWNQSVVLRPDGTYHFIYFSTGLTWDNVGRRWGQLRRPPSDGTYRYQKSGDTTGVLTLEDPTGTLPPRDGFLSDTTRTTLALDFSAHGFLPASSRRGWVSGPSAGYLVWWAHSPWNPALGTPWPWCGSKAGSTLSCVRPAKAVQAARP